MTPMRARFTDQPLHAVLTALDAHLRDAPPGAVCVVEAPDPDACAETHSGELRDGRRYRPWAVWVRVAEQLGCELTTPGAIDDDMVRFGLRRLPRSSWHESAIPSGHPEKYGARSMFALIDKFEQPDLVVAFDDAVALIDPPADARVLALGCNQGDELAVVTRTIPGARCVGLDHSATAIARGLERFPRLDLRVADLRDDALWSTLEPQRFDLVVAINVLHSPSLDGQGILRRLVADHLTPAGGLIIGRPNSRHVGPRLRYGAAVKGYRRPELSVLVRDLSFYKRYLARQRFRVTITGQHTVLVTAKALPERVARRSASTG